MPRHAQGTGEPPITADAGPGASGSGPRRPPGRARLTRATGPISHLRRTRGAARRPIRRPGSGPVPGAGPASGARGPPPFPGTGSPSYPGAGAAPYPDQPAPFPGWTLHNTPGAAGGRTAPGPGTPAGPATPMTPVASPRPGQASGPPWELSRETGALGGPDGSGPGPGTAEPDGSGDIKGLPRRVKQASLAPQLRASPPQRRTTVASASGSPAPAGAYGFYGAFGSESGRDPPDHVGASARLAGGPFAADGRLAIS